MQYNIKTLHYTKCSNCPPLALTHAKITTDLSLEQWPFNDACPTVNKVMPQLADISHCQDSILCGTKVWDVRKPQMGAKSSISRQRSLTLTAVSTQWVDALYCWNSSWLSVFKLVKNMKYADNRKKYTYIENYRNRRGLVKFVPFVPFLILDTSHLSHPLGEGGGPRDNIWCSSWAHWKAHSGGFPIRVNWTFFARCYVWGPTSENR